MQWSLDLHRGIPLPADVVLSLVTSRLSKEGLLTIEAPRNPAFCRAKEVWTSRRKRSRLKLKMKQNRQVMQKIKINSLGLILKTSGVVLHGFKCAFQMIPICDGYNSGLSRDQNLFTVSKLLGGGILLYVFSTLVYLLLLVFNTVKV